MVHPWYHWDDDDLIMRLRVQPRASRDELCGVHGDSYRVRITAPPVEGKANIHLRGFLAKAFGVSRSAVILEAGESNREKRVRICHPDRLAITEIKRRIP